MDYPVPMHSVRRGRKQLQRLSLREFSDGANLAMAMRNTLKQLKMLQRQLETMHRATAEVMLESQRLVERLNHPEGLPASAANASTAPESPPRRNAPGPRRRTVKRGRPAR
jgi:regulator of replication initiation timing